MEKNFFVEYRLGSLGMWYVKRLLWSCFALDMCTGHVMITWQLLNLFVCWNMLLNNRYIILICLHVNPSVWTMLLLFSKLAVHSRLIAWRKPGGSHIWNWTGVVHWFSQPGASRERNIVLKNKTKTGTKNIGPLGKRLHFVPKLRGHCKTVIFDL